jgi:hypothetical protein
MQTVLVIITFFLAVGFLMKKLIWNPIADPKRKSSNVMNDHKKNCGSSGCQCE